MEPGLLCRDRGAVASSAPTVSAIARAHGAALRASCALSWEQQAVLRDLERCRTAALGGHKHVCDTCGYTKPMYNSCRNRHCPTCQSIEQHRWLERREQTILPVPYFHLVFTLPSELRPVVASNRERMFGLLFETASQTLLLLARDERHLGATPAITMVLHTWTRELTFHPHVHAVVSAGGLGADGQWVAARKGYLFPVKVMARLFRRLLREALLTAIEREEVRVAAEHETLMRKALFEVHTRYKRNRSKCKHCCRNALSANSAAPASSGGYKRGDFRAARAESGRLGDGEYEPRTQTSIGSGLPYPE